MRIARAHRDHEGCRDPVGGACSVLSFVTSSCRNRVANLKASERLRGTGNTDSGSLHCNMTIYDIEVDAVICFFPMKLISKKGIAIIYKWEDVARHSSIV